MFLIISGMIGTGKTILTKQISKLNNLSPIFEEVENNPFLKSFYKKNKNDKNRYPFLLQLYFLERRFKSLNKALRQGNCILDRSFYEDEYFAKINNKLKKISNEEYFLYKIYNKRLEELIIKNNRNKSPDLLIYLKSSFDKVLENIDTRGRKEENIKENKDYFYALWKNYDNWVMDYEKSSVLIINSDKYNFHDEKDIKIINQKILEIKNKKGKVVEILGE